MNDAPANNQSGNVSGKSSPPNRRLTVAIIAVCALLSAGLVIYLIVSHKFTEKAKQSDKPASTKQLHIFPPVDFTDTAYYKEIAASNEDMTPKVIYYYEKDSTGKPTENKVHETYLYPGNKKYVDGNVAQGERDGLWYAYYPDGTVQTKAYYVNGKQHGQYTVYYENGNVRYEGRYNMGTRIGEWNFYNEDGSIERVVNFNMEH